MVTIKSCILLMDAHVIDGGVSYEYLQAIALTWTCFQQYHWFQVINYGNRFSEDEKPIVLIGMKDRS